MTTWFTGHGWGWCTAMVNAPATVLLWGAFLTALILALRSAFTRHSLPGAPMGTDAAERGGPAVAPTARGETDDDFSRRFM